VYGLVLVAVPNVRPSTCSPTATIVVPVSDAVTVTVTESVSMLLAAGLVIATVGEAAKELSRNHPFAVTSIIHNPVARTDLRT
jgi:hypothetical protein